MNPNREELLFQLALLSIEVTLADPAKLVITP
jgi:hypothetical protein